MGIALAGALAAGCVPPSVGTVPRGNARLTVQKIAEDGDLVITLIKIQTIQDVTIVVKTDSSESRQYDANVGEGTVREAAVLLSASRIATPGEPNAHIQLTLQTQVGGATTGGPSVYTVPAETTLESYLTVSAVDGIYPLGNSVEIGQIQGKPIVLNIVP